MGAATLGIEAQDLECLSARRGGARQRLAALADIKDAGAVPAIELILAGQSEDGARAAIAQIRDRRAFGIAGPGPEAVFHRG